ncbi:aminotransferase class I/II-fold pyridoxal phosphate-dependent enzyme [Phaeobacter sp. J2-8]|uniref:trans-sulfuration enzyme family protein n=1 Tax=Phaeobacter sp. J2-8 TaxID=2931394 RepID=UPI001FD174D6|nr:aminotransferase class I/II-fold pyridoxal phosphate-dependent enzyme [Phaeobacter sp. J2-8]MCJ7872064.1 aminotransferase class I/II-fold pyridoxal phosphate-dependent enzyme [Phaeobacter sp. J2-8]
MRLRNDKGTLMRPDLPTTGVSRPVVTPLSPSVVYASDTPDMLDSQYAGLAEGFTYAREGHPNADVLARRIAAMEGVDQGIVVGSGMAAVTAVLLGLCKAGDHVLGSDQLYGRSLRMMREDLPRFGIAADLADATDIEAFRAAVRPNTRMILIEVVSNPTLRVADMIGIAALAKETGAILVVDNTFTTPSGFLPFDHGADVVLHSVTKLLAGHADVTLGWAAARDPDHQKAIYDFAVTTGLTASPFDCWLAERGLFTFDLRFDRAQRTAAALADALADMAGVRRVIYPMRADHPENARANLILRGGCNMVSFEIAGGRAQANALTEAARGIAFAPTLGDVGTTLSHPASSSHRALTPEARAAMGMTEGFFRVSVGLEDPEALIAEFAQATAAAQAV